MLGFFVPSSGRHFRCSSSLLILTICGQLWFRVAHVDIPSFSPSLVGFAKVKQSNDSFTNAGPVLFQRPLSDCSRASIVSARKLLAQVPARQGYTNAFDLETNVDRTGALFCDKPDDAGLSIENPIISGGGSTEAFSGLVMTLDSSTDLGVSLKASVKYYFPDLFSFVVLTASWRGAERMVVDIRMHQNEFAFVLSEKAP